MVVGVALSPAPWGYGPEPRGVRRRGRSGLGGVAGVPALTDGGASTGSPSVAMAAGAMAVLAMLATRSMATGHLTSDRLWRHGGPSGRVGAVSGLASEQI